MLLCHGAVFDYMLAPWANLLGFGKLTSKLDVCSQLLAIFANFLQK
jgi:hypothetical protein